MRIKLAKGMQQGGLVPFGFTVHPETEILTPTREQVKSLEQLFRT